MTALRVEALNVWFDLPAGGRLHAVQSVSLAVGGGQLLGLVGESGCGKSTAMLAVMGLLPPAATVAGRVTVGGTEVLEGGERGIRRHRWVDVAIVFQGAMNALNPVLTVGRQIVEPMELHGVARGVEARRRTEELLVAVGVPPSASRSFPHELSGGMRQRVALAMALACRPRVLLADEPTTGLDVVVQAQILRLLADLAAEQGLAVVLVSHDLPLVAQACARVAVMYAGQVVEQGPVGRLFAAPAHPYTELLLGAAPDLFAGGPVASIPGYPPRLDRPMAGCPFAPRCPRAQPRCAGTPPAAVSIGSDHQVSCHLVGAGAP